MGGPGGRKTAVLVLTYLHKGAQRGCVLWAPRAFAFFLKHFCYRSRAVERCMCCLA